MIPRVTSSLRYIPALVRALALCLSALMAGCAVTPPVAERLPFEQRFPADTRLTVYPTGEPSLPATIEGKGAWTLRFEKTDSPAVASVRLVDARISLAPFTIFHDANGDGRAEAIDVGAIELDSSAFDLERSRGTLDLDSGDFSMTVAQRLDPETVPALARLGIGPLRFSFTERGYMDLERGVFSTHSPEFSLPAPLAAVRVGAGENPCCPVASGFAVRPKLICAKGCVPGAQTVEFYCTVQHERNGQACKPSSFKAEIRNNTEGQKLVSVKPGTWKHSGTGIYQAVGITTVVDTDVSIKRHPKAPKTTFELAAFAPDCDAEVNLEEIGVLRDARPFQICTKGADTHGQASWILTLPPGNASSYGKGILVDRVENPAGNPYSVKVSYGGVTDILAPGAPPSKAFRDKQPGYGWNVWMPGGTPGAVPTPKDFCLNVWLYCKCGAL